ncbi:MAG: hypothetical protein ABFR62_11390 [Bacteroidota bacterium]
MKSEWLVKYEDSEIKIVNTWFHGEMLFVNNMLQDKRYGLAGSNLSGHIINKEGKRENIKVNLGGSFKIDCNVFIDDNKVEVQKRK